MKKTIVSEVKKLAVVMFGTIICAFSVEAFGNYEIGRASCRERV